jgi:hypothetical protein
MTARRNSCIRVIIIDCLRPNGSTMAVKSVSRRAAFLAASTLAFSASSQGAPRTAYAKSATTSRPGFDAPPRPAEQGSALRLVLAPDGNAARYRVRGRLTNHDFPNDAIGETKSLSGAISFDKAGKVIRDASKFTLDASTFVSDQNRRDGFVRGRLLEADTYPTISLLTTEVSGVTLPLPKCRDRARRGEGRSYPSRRHAPDRVEGDCCVQGGPGFRKCGNFVHFHRRPA